MLTSCARVNVFGERCRLRVYLIGDDDGIRTLFVFKGCLPSRTSKLPSATVYRKYYVLCFDTSHALRIDLSPISLLNEGSSNVAQTPSLFAGPRGTRCRAHPVEAA